MSTWAAFAGWIATKGQIDFGNALVGVGGLALAWATVCSTRSSNRSAQSSFDKQANRKIAEFRMSWMDTFRSDIAEYIRLHRNIELIRSKSISKSVPANERDRLLDLTQVRSRLQMMLKENSDKQNESNLLKLLSEDVDHEAIKAKEQRLNTVKLARSVLKDEWIKIKAEIKD